MQKSITINVKCKCGTTTKGVIPDANGRIETPETLCTKCYQTCEQSIPETKPKGKGKKK